MFLCWILPTSISNLFDFSIVLTLFPILKPSYLYFNFTFNMFPFLSSFLYILRNNRSQWPRDLRRGFAAVYLLGLRVRIPPGHVYLSLVSAVYCQVEVSAPADHLSRGVLPSLVWLTECEPEALIIRWPWLSSGCCVMEKTTLHNFPSFIGHYDVIYEFVIII